MCIRDVALKPIHWGLRPQASRGQQRRRLAGIAIAIAVVGGTRVARTEPAAVAAKRTAVVAAPVEAEPAEAAAGAAARTNTPSANTAPSEAGSTSSAPATPVPTNAPPAHAAGTASPPREPSPIAVPPGRFAPSWDLDGTYLWLGPLGAASHVDARWDSTFGVDAALVVVRERAPLAVIGANLGASRWTARGGGRVWVDGVLGTHLLDRMMGISLGPLVELSALAHPRLGASIGVWGFAGITPFARVGAVSDLGIFAEIGIHISLPVVRR